MRRVLAITLNDLRVYFSEIGNLIGLIALPVTLTLVLGFLQSSGPSSIFADVIDHDESAESAALIATMQAVNDTLVLCGVDEANANRCGLAASPPLTEDESIDRIQRGSGVRALIVIPEGYGEQLNAGSPVAIAYYAQASGANSFNDPIRAALETAVQRANGAITASDAALYAIEHNRLPAGTIAPLILADDNRAAFAADVRQQAESILAENPIMVSYELAGEVQASNDGFGQAVPGQGATFVMFTVLGGMALLVRERNQWTLQRLVSSPLSRAQILGGKIMAYFTLGMIQFAVVFIVGILTGTDFGDAPLAIFLLMIAFVLAVTAIGFALANWLTSENQVGSVSLLLALTLAPLGGAWWPLEITPQFMQIIGHISPVAWAMDGFQSVIFFGGGLANVLLPVAVLMAYAAVFFSVAIAGFRRS